MTNGYRAAAYDHARQEYSKYFEALEVHPRMLVGKQVPSMSGEGAETLKSTQDARDWQEAVKEILQQEIEGQAQSWMGEATGFIDTIHGSIDLFKNNPDLIPGTKGFDKDLADRFAALAKAYEVRIDGRLHGYSVPVQPLIDSLRQQRPKAAPRPAPKKKAAEPPQRSVTSKAPSNAEAEDFSTLFGTIGLPQLRI